LTGQEAPHDAGCYRYTAARPRIYFSSYPKPLFCSRNILWYNKIHGGKENFL